MDLQLKGKRAIVTGSNAGIGAAIVRYLAQEGATVVVHGRDEERARKVADEIKSKGGTAHVATGAITDDKTVARICEEATKAAGGIDILINNAGTYPMASWFESKTQEWIDSYNLDVVSNVRFIQQLVPAMKERGWGRVIQISSASGVLVPANFFPIYSVSKAAQTFMTKHLAIELTNTGVTVNTVSPGPASSETNIQSLTKEAEQAGRPTDWASVERHYVETLMDDPPVPRMVRPEEVAPLVAYLASPLADAVTGANYLIDSGYAISGFKRQHPAEKSATQSA